MPETQNTPLLRVKDLRKFFPLKGSWLRPESRGRVVRAVDGVSFDLAAGETLGLVGESGCGKTTAGRVILGLEPATSGEVYIGDSPDLTRMGRLEWRGGAAAGEGAGAIGWRNPWLPYRRRIQMIFQDPYSSLNPRMTAEAIVAEPLAIHRLAPRAARRERVAELFEQVGLSPDARHRFPHEFSGGQRQRIGVARALAVGPEILIADEPVSALDVSIQAQIVNLLQELQENHGLSFVFISHDLAVVGHISHRVAVMYLGRIVEIGPKQALYDKPLHPYTLALMNAVPTTEGPRRGKRLVLEGDIPSPIDPPPGCPFHPRCPRRFEGCDREAPALREVETGHSVSCRLFDSEQS